MQCKNQYVNKTDVFMSFVCNFEGPNLRSHTFLEINFNVLPGKISLNSQ